MHLEDQWLIMIRHARAPTVPAYRLIQPWAEARITPSNARWVLEEATRALDHCPDGTTFAWAYKANALWNLHRIDEAITAGSKVPARIGLW